MANYVPELLAPAGSIDALKAAVNAGADAVYISGKKFGARKFATNFSESEIEEGLKYAKLRGVKVYVTVNTLIKDSQLKSVAEYLIWLYKTGVDAVIIQDLGVAYLSNKIVPNLDMHASTQMTIHNTPGAEWASKFGFKRVVLSRELGIAEVEEIKTNAGKIEIEIFGHGALCYSYSGQCLLSSFIGGRSGNKGMCAQPCRKQYKLICGNIDRYGRPLEIQSIDLDEKYLLSTRDLSVYENLDRITSSKIDSLKIEGRMRSAEYVAIVVNIYRKALDSISYGKWKPNNEDISKLKLAFNRGFTGGYLTGTYEKLVMGREAPGNRGLYIGKVQDSTGSKTIVKVDNKFKLEKGDGIVFLSPIKNLNKFEYEQGRYEKHNQNKRDDRRSNGIYETLGMALEDTPKYKGNKLILDVGRTVKRGSKLYLTRSISLNHYAKYIIKNSIKPSIPMDIKMVWDDDLKPILKGEFTGFDGLKHIVHLKSKYSMEKALKKPLDRDQIENQLQKTGETSFILRKVSIKYSGDLFAPISKLNQFRREFLDKAEFELIESYKPSEFEVEKAKNRYANIEKSPHGSEESLNTDMVVAVYADSIDTVKGALDGGAKRVYLEPKAKEHFKNICNSFDQTPENSYKSVDDEDPEEISRISSLLISAENLCKENRAEFIWKWPQITHEDQINNYKKVLESGDNDFQEVMVDGLGAAEWTDQNVPNLKLSGSAGLNIWNKNTVLMLSKIFNTLTPSPELSKKDLKTVIASSRLNGVKSRFELVVQGNVETLISKDCLHKIIPKNYNCNMENQFWGIQDDKNRIFPVKIDSEGRTHILNSVELCLVDHLPEISQIGIDGVVVDARNKTYDYAKDMTSIYCEGLEYSEKGINTRKNLNQLKSKIKIISTGGITTGNFLKGVKEK
jgi:U32 family peptidase